MLPFEPKLFELTLFHAVKTVHSLSSKSSKYWKETVTFLFANCIDLIIIFNSNLPHCLIFQSRKLLCSSWLLLPFPSRTCISSQHRTFTNIWSNSEPSESKSSTGICSPKTPSPLAPFACDAKKRELSLETLRKHRSLTAGTHNFHKVWTVLSGSSVWFSSSG